MKASTGTSGLSLAAVLLLLNACGQIATDGIDETRRDSPETDSSSVTASCGAQRPAIETEGCDTAATEFEPAAQVEPAPLPAMTGVLLPSPTRPLPPPVPTPVTPLVPVPEPESSPEPDPVPVTLPPVEEGPIERSPDGPSFQASVAAIFDQKCTDSCHEPNGVLGGPGGVDPLVKQDLTSAAAYATLTTQPSAELPSMWLVGSSLEQSYLWHKLNDTHLEVGGKGIKMPALGTLTISELALVRAWIEGGASP